MGAGSFHGAQGAERLESYGLQRRPEVNPVELVHGTAHVPRDLTPGTARTAVTSAATTRAGAHRERVLVGAGHGDQHRESQRAADLLTRVEQARDQAGVGAVARAMPNAISAGIAAPKPTPSNSIAGRICGTNATVRTRTAVSPSAMSTSPADSTGPLAEASDQRADNHSETAPIATATGTIARPVANAV